MSVVGFLLTVFLATAAKLPASVMSDQAFFGVWNSSTNTWSTVGKINYAYNSPALASVEAAVKANDYSTASTALLTYMRNRPAKNINAPSRNTNVADLAKNFTFIGTQPDELAGEITVSSTSYAIKSLKFVDSTLGTPLVNKNFDAAVGKGRLGFLIMGKTKPQSIVTTIYSKENGSSKPTLEVVINGTTYTLTAIADTWIEGGGSTAHGGDLILKSRASGLNTDGFDANEYRTNLVFDLTSLPTTNPVQTATLKLNMANSAAGSATHYVFSNADTAWTEGTRAWTNVAGNVYSWTGVTGGAPWTLPTNGDREFRSVINRQEFGIRLAAEYQAYMAQSNATTANTYALSLFNHFVDFANDTPPGHPTQLEGPSPTPFYGNVGLRLSLWVSAYHWSLSSTALTNTAHTTILKRFWEDINFLNDPAHFTGYLPPPDGASNHAALETIGLFQGAIFFPEFTGAASWQSTAVTRAMDMLTALTYPDGSYKEGTSGYSLSMLELFNTNIKMFGQNNGYTFPASYNTELLEFARFNMHQTDPNGDDIMLGDAGFRSRKAILADAGTAFSDPDLTYVGTGVGSAPTQTSSYYPDGRYITQRSDWTPNALFLTFQNTGAVTHAHRDLLAVTVNAYGRRLLVDTGVHTYDYANYPDWFIYFVQNTLTHNTIHVGTTSTVTINGVATAVGAQALHGTTAQSISKYSSNAGFELAIGYHQAYPNVTHTRSVFFVRPEYWIVSDTLVNTASGNQDYRQNWHFLPDANITTPDANGRMKTQYGGTGGNLTIVPADPASITSYVIDDYYAAVPGAATPAKSIRYKKTWFGTMTFDTVLYPTPGTTSKNVTVTRLTPSDGVTAGVATALKIDTNNGAGGDLGYYYLSKETTYGTRSFDIYNYNGRLAYIQTTSTGTVKKVSVADGKVLKKSGVNLVQSNSVISSLDAVWSGTTLAINGAQLQLSTDTTNGIGIYGPSVTAVTVNGQSKPFVKDSTGNYVYAVKN